jgi:predicted transcriptional regulator
MRKKFELCLFEEERELLDELARAMRKSRSAVLRKGLQLVKHERDGTLQARFEEMARRRRSPFDEE